LLQLLYNRSEVQEQKKTILEHSEKMEKPTDLKELFSLYYAVSQRTAIILQEVIKDVVNNQ